MAGLKISLSTLVLLVGTSGSGGAISIASATSDNTNVLEPSQCLQLLRNVRGGGSLASQREQDAPRLGHAVSEYQSGFCEKVVEDLVGVTNDNDDDDDEENVNNVDFRPVANGLSSPIQAVVDWQRSRQAVRMGAGNELCWQSLFDTNLQQAATALQGTVGRFPGGTPSDYWNWRTGWYEGTKLFESATTMQCMSTNTICCHSHCDMQNITRDACGYHICDSCSWSMPIPKIALLVCAPRATDVPGVAVRPGTPEGWAKWANVSVLCERGYYCSVEVRTSLMLEFTDTTHIG